jgi:lysophospholipase L1-like esterase
MSNREDDRQSAAGVRKSVVACLGSSSTAGKGQAFDWIGALRMSCGNEKYLFLNFGVGGDLAYNALQRLPDVIACRPDKVVVLVGGNDALALVSTKAKRFFRVAKHLPCEPSSEWFRTNLQAIAHRLKAETSATIALCSLTPIGEDPEPTNPFQREINQRIEEYSAIIRDVAREENAEYIAVYESMQARVQASPGKALTSFRFLLLYRDAFRVLLLHRSPDEIAQMNGWRLHTDGVHLNSQGGMIIADLVQKFIAHQPHCGEHIRRPATWQRRPD